jgi:hypothetical protein
LWDLRLSDVFGFDHFRHFKREGTQFPVPFNMKDMSRVAFSCRHPLMTGFYVMFLGNSLFDVITLGKAMFLAYFSIAIMLGIHFEERELIRHAGPSFK